MAFSSRLELVVDTRTGAQRLREFEGQLDRTQGSGDRLAKGMSVLKIAFGAMSAALGGIGFSKAISEMAAFEDSMLGLQAVSGATTTQMAELEKQARTLGATSTFSAQQAGNAQRYLAQAGFEVNEILTATPGLLNLAAAGQIDLARAADISSNALGGFGLAVEELDRVVDVMAATAAGANTSIEQLGLALSYAAPFASAAGVSIEETSAAIGAMSDAGIQAGRAGTGLVGIIRELSRITPATAKGLESAGLAVKEVDISTRGLLPVLETLNKAGLNVTQAIEIFGSEAGAAAINVIEASDKVSDFSEKLQDAEGAAKNMALIIESGLTGSMKSFASMVSEATISLGRDNGIASGFQSVTDTATGVLAVYNDLLPEFVEANSLTQDQVARIEMLAAGLDLLKDVAILTAGVYGARFVSAMAAGTAQMAVKTVATVRDQQAEVSAANATVRRTAAEKQAATALLSTTRIEEQATRGTAAHTFALQQLSVARTRATAAAGAHAAATSVATAAMDRAAVSARLASGALGLVGGPLGAAIIAGSAMYYFRDSLGFASAEARETRQEIDQLVGSIEGLTHAQYQNQWRSLYDGAADARAEVEKLQKQIESLQERSSQESVMYQGRGGAASSQITRLQAELQEQLRVLGAAEEGLRKYERAWEDFQKSQITGASIFRTLDQWLFDTGESAQRTSREFSALSYALGTGGDGWDDYISKLRGARDVLGMTADEAAAYAAQQQGFTGVYADMAAAVAGQTDALEGYRRAIAAGNDEEAQAHLDRARRFAEAEAMVQAQLLNMETLTNLLKGVQTELSAVALTSALTVADAGGAGAAYVANAIRAINERAAAIQRTTAVTASNTAANREAREAERALANAERERQRVLDDSISAYADLFKQLSPAGAATAEYNATVARLTVAHEDGTKSAFEYYAAIGQAAKLYNDAVRAADPNIKRMEQLSQQYDRAYNRGQQLATAVDDISAAYRRGDIDGQQYTRMMGTVRDEMQQLALEADPAAQEMARAWEEAANRIDETFADAFAGAFDSFGSFADQLMNGFKRLLAELAYQATLKPIVLGFTQDMRGLMSGGGMGFGNAIGAAQTLYGSGSKLLAGGASASAAGGLYAGAATQTAGTLYGSAATGAAIGPATSAGIMSSISAGVSAAMPWIAGGLAIDTLLGGSITKAIGGLFGGGKSNPRLNISTRGDMSDFGHESVRAGAFGAVGFSEGTRRSNDLFGGVEAEREWLAAVAAMDNLTASVARTPEQLDAMTQAVRHNVITAGDAATANDMLAQRTLAAVGAIDGGLAASLRGLGISAEEITGRVVSAAEAMQLMSAASGRLNLQYDAGADGALRLADSLAQYAGGVENLANIQQAYYQAVFSETERMQHSLEDVRGSLNALTSENITSVEHLRQLVEAQNLNSEAGQRLAYDLMALAPALQQSNAAVKDAIRQQYQSALGREADADGLAYWFSQVTNGALSLRGALENIAASSDKAADAANGAGNAIDSAANILREREQLERQLLAALGNTAELRRRELAALDPSNRAIQERLYAIQDERDYLDSLQRQQEERIRTINQERDAMARAREQWQSFGNSIQGWIDGLNASDAGLGTPREQLEASDAAFWSQYEKALAGDRNAQQSITQYADRYAENLREMYASGTGAQNGIDEIRDALSKLPEQLTPEDFIAEEFRKAINDQTASLKNILDLNGDGVVSAIERSITAEWSTTDRLNNVLHQEMRRLGTTVLTENQIRTALRPHATDAEINRLISRVDRNGDGLISRQELTNARLDALGGGIAQSLLPLFSEIDLDASGLIDYSEFSRAFDGMATDETLSQIFGLIDANGDGQLSYLEAIAASSSTLVQLWAKQQPDNVKPAISDITRMYESALGRAPDLPGLQYWVDQYLGGASLQTIEKSIQQHIGKDASANAGSGNIGGGSTKPPSQPAPTPPARTPRPLWERALDADWTDVQRSVVESYMRSNQQSALLNYANSRRVEIPAYATGAWDLAGDHLAQVHQGEFIAPSAGGIADEFRAYASGNYHAEMMGEMSALRADAAPALKAFPLLNQSDVTQVMRDMQRTIERQGQQIAALLKQGNTNTGNTAAATANAAAEARRQREAQLRETESQGRTLRLQKTGAVM